MDSQVMVIFKEPLVDLIIGTDGSLVMLVIFTIYFLFIVWEFHITHANHIHFSIPPQPLFTILVSHTKESVKRNNKNKIKMRNKR